MKKTRKLFKFHSRKGMLLPLVLGTLVVIGVSFYALSQGGTQAYRSVAMINHNTHAHYVAYAAMEEATVFLHQALTHPSITHNNSPWRNEMLKSILNSGQYKRDITDTLQTAQLLYGNVLGDPYGAPDPGGFQGGGRVFDYEAYQRNLQNRGKIKEATVEFHHFNPIKFHESVGYDDDKAYYMDPLGYSSGAPKGDMWGFYTIKVKAQFGIVERDFILTRDVKISNNAPIARQYVAFFTDVPDGGSQESDLNSPGNFYIDGKGAGKIFIQGPYVIEAEGISDGTQGDGPAGLNYTEEGAEWNQYGFLPTPRAITSCLIGSSIKRPWNTSGGGVSAGVGSSCFSVPIPWDPGNMGQPEIQTYWAGATDVGKQSFSISGAPGSFHTWKGVLFKKGAKSAAPQGEWDGVLDSIPLNSEARVEGMLLGKYNIINYTKHHTCTSMTHLLNTISELIPESEDATVESTACTSPLVWNLRLQQCTCPKKDQVYYGGMCNTTSQMCGGDLCKQFEQDLENADRQYTDEGYEDAVKAMGADLTAYTKWRKISYEQCIANKTCLERSGDNFVELNDNAKCQNGNFDKKEESTSCNQAFQQVSKVVHEAHAIWQAWKFQRDAMESIHEQCQSMLQQCEQALSLDKELFSSDSPPAGPGTCRKSLLDYANSKLEEYQQQWEDKTITSENYGDIKPDSNIIDTDPRLFKKITIPGDQGQNFENVDCPSLSRAIQPVKSSSLYLASYTSNIFDKNNIVYSAIIPPAQFITPKSPSTEIDLLTFYAAEKLLKIVKQVTALSTLLSSLINNNLLSPTIHQATASAEGLDTTKKVGNSPDTGGVLSSLFSQGSGGTNSLWSQLGSFVSVCMHFYSLRDHGSSMSYYSLQRYDQKIAAVEIMAGLANDVMTGLQGLGNTNEGKDLASGLSAMAKNLTASAATANQQRNMISGGLQAGDTTPAPRVFPSNFKPFMRTATRRYQSLSDYIKETTGNESRPEIFLDGNLWVDELKSTRPITYYGVGTIASAFVPSSKIFGRRYDASITEMRAGSTEDHLNVFYLNSSVPESGGGMLSIQGGIVEASVYSMQGARPVGSAVILGNLVGGYINKSQFGSGNQLVVAYDTEKYKAEEDSDEALKWYAISVSPKISGLGYDIQGIGGTGDDGVANIVESLDAPSEPEVELPDEDVSTAQTGLTTE
jgi:hypothetical protein